MPEDRSDINFVRMQENRRRLEAAKDARGQKLEIIEVPQPKRNLRRADGRRLSTSYVNFYIANGGIVMPSFDDPNDKAAAEIVGAAFPGREVVQVPALDIAAGGGVIHCITQQQPAGEVLA